MKKRLIAVTAALGVLCLTACGSAQGTTNTGTTEASAEGATETADSADAGDTAAADDTAAGENAAESTKTGTEMTSGPAEDGSGTVTDMTGRQVVIPETVERVVALTASDCEILYEIGAGDLVVGRGEYCDYPEEVLELPVVQSGADTNIEQIIALEPQIVFMSTMAQTTEQIAALEAAGIAVVASEAPDFARIYDSINLIGAVTGHADEAAAVVQEMQDAFMEMEVDPAGDGMETIYFEVSPLEYGLWAAGGGSFMDEIAQIVGVKNIFQEEPSWAEVSEEQVIERNPDYIVSITMYDGEGPTPEEEILSRTGWENVTAVKKGAVLNLRNNELSRPVPRLVEGARMLYDFIMESKAEEDAA